MWNYPFNWDLSQDLARVGWSHQTAIGLRSEVLASHPILFTPVLCRWAVITLALPSWGEGSACGAKLQHCSVLQWQQGQCGRWWRWNPTPWSCPPLRPASHCLMYCPNQVLVRRLWGEELTWNLAHFSDVTFIPQMHDHKTGGATLELK